MTTRKTRHDSTVDICMLWNERKITAEEAISKIYKLYENSVLERLDPDKVVRKCPWCFNKLPKHRTTYCNKECMNNHKKEVGE